MRKLILLRSQLKMNKKRKWFLRMPTECQQVCSIFAIKKQHIHLPFRRASIILTSVYVTFDCTLHTQFNLLTTSILLFIWLIDLKVPKQTKNGSILGFSFLIRNISKVSVAYGFGLRCIALHRRLALRDI